MKKLSAYIWEWVTDTLKKDVADLIVETIQPIQARYSALVNSSELDTILDEGAQKARETAEKTYRQVELAMGLYRK